MNPLPDDSAFDTSAFDDRLRTVYDEAGAPPPPPLRAWAGLQPHLLPPVVPPAPRAAVRPALLGGVGGLLLGLLLMWGWLTPTALRPESAAPAVAASSRPDNHLKGPGELPTVVEGAGTVVEGAGVGVEGAGMVVEGARLAVEGAGTVAEGAETDVEGARLVVEGAGVGVEGARLAVEGAGVGVEGARLAVEGVLATSSPAVSVVLLPLVQAEAAFAAAPADSAQASLEQRRVALLAQRAELARLRYRTDSLLLGLGVAPEPAPLAEAAPDSVPVAPFRRWSVALSFAPERNFFGLQSAPADTLSALRRTHEQGRAGYNAAVLAEYRLTPRWSVAAGAGLTSYGAELRLTDRRTDVKTSYDTQTSQTSETTHLDYWTYSIRIVDEPTLSPVFNENFQLVGYDTVLVPRPDTVWTHNITDGTIATNTITTTPTVTTRQEVSTRILRPNYRFLTVPLLVRYRLGTEGGTFRGATANRWWADVALGAQVQFFLGGTQLVSADGRTWRTERVGAGGGPFRPLTVALTGAVALNYALTPRLSASVAPTLRYQTESVYKASTGLTQRPAATGVQLGLRLAF